MASTNKTTNYQLSQFTGTDKPAWLGDYNQDMSKIDTGMKNNADDIAGCQGTLNTHQAAIDANTQAVETLQQESGTVDDRITAVEAKNAEQDTAIATAQNKADQADGKADTNATNIASQALDIASLQSESQSQDTAITRNASNITNVANSLNTFKSSLTLSKFTDASTLANHTSRVNLHLAESADSSIFKVYGSYWEVTGGSAVTYARVAITGLSGYYGIKSTLKLTNGPAEAFVINSAGVFQNRYQSGSATSFETYAANIAVGSDGYIYFDVSTSNSSTIRTYVANLYYFPPCVYFNTNFGDEPSPEPDEA